MLNLDMVGRSRGAVDVSGLDNADAAKATYGGRAGRGRARRQAGGPGAGRSDDSSFLGARVPAVNFFTGFHTDYHRPTRRLAEDRKAGTARVATLALEFAARLRREPAPAEFLHGNQ